MNLAARSRATKSTACSVPAKESKLSRTANTLLLGMLFCLGCNPATHPSADVPSDSAEILMKRANGACLATVVKLVEKNEMPSDGDHFIEAWLQPEESSGKVPDFLYLVIQHGGMMPVESILQHEAQLKTQVLRHDSLSIGERHWFLFSGDHDPARFPYQVAGWWRYDDGDVPPNIINAIASNRFGNHPAWDSTLDVVTSWKQDGEQADVQVRKAGSMDRTDLVFTQQIPGKIKEVKLHHHPTSYELEWPEKRETHLVNVATVASLPKENEFDLPGGTYRINHAFDLETGQRLAVWVAANQEIWLMHAFKQFSLEDGKPEIDMQFGLLDSGGRAAGGESEAWYRRVVNRLQDGELISTKIYRHPHIQTGNEAVFSSSGWIPVED